MPQIDECTCPVCESNRTRSRTRSSDQYVVGTVDPDETWGGLRDAFSHWTVEAPISPEPVDTPDPVEYNDSRTVDQTDGEETEVPEDVPQIGPGSICKDRRKYGIEIEVNLPRTRNGTVYDLEAKINELGVPVLNQSYSHRGHGSSWMIKRDGSLSHLGYEIVSPPMKGRKGMEQLRKVCEALKAVGARPTTRCGLHVHHDVQDLSLAQFKNVVLLWCGYQGQIDTLIQRRRRSNRRHEYASALSRSEINSIIQMRSLDRIPGFSRYRGLNVMSYPSYGTIEIRQHQSTIKYTEIAQWVRLGQAVIRKAKNMPEPLDSPYAFSGDMLGVLADLGIDHHRGLVSRTRWLQRRMAASPPSW